MSTDTRTPTRIVRDVLTLVDGYLATQPQDALTTDGRGLMTWAELRQHLAGAKALLAIEAVSQETRPASPSAPHAAPK